MDTIRAITSEQDLREIIGVPTDVVTAKLADRLNDLTRQFIERSPFVCVATGRPGGGMDVSPRGDPPGFVRVLDERTVLLPERPGNRIADTLVNLLSDPRIAMLFLIPGVGDTFRVNGTAVITDDAELLAPVPSPAGCPSWESSYRSRRPTPNAPRRSIRSELWNPEHHIERSVLPSSGEILKAISLPELDVAEHERARAERYARGDGLY